MRWNSVCWDCGQTVSKNVFKIGVIFANGRDFCLDFSVHLLLILDSLLPKNAFVWIEKVVI